MSIFYKVTAPNGKVSHLFGTIPKNNSDVVLLPRVVKDALEQASDYVSDTDLNGLSVDEMIPMMTGWMQNQFPHHKHIAQDSLANAIKDLQKAIKKRLKEKNIAIDPEEAKHMATVFVLATPPILLAIGLMQEDENKEKVLLNMINTITERLLKHAITKGKTTHSLLPPLEYLKDTMGYQFNILEQVEFYCFIKYELAKGRRFLSFKEIEKAYQKEDIEALSTVFAPFPADADVPDTVRSYYVAQSSKREDALAVQMQAHLNKGDAFITISANNLMGVTSQLKAAGYVFEAVPLGKRHYSIEGTLEDGEKVAAFRKIYMALFLAQTSFFKKRGFIPGEEKLVSIEQIQQYANTHKNTRSYKAWELAQKHYQDVSANNNELLKSICQEGYAKSSSLFGLFKRTKTNLDDTQSVATAAVDSRTGMVRDTLNGLSV